MLFYTKLSSVHVTLIIRLLLILFVIIIFIFYLLALTVLIFHHISAIMNFEKNYVLQSKTQKVLKELIEREMFCEDFIVKQNTMESLSSAMRTTHFEDV